MCVEVAVAGTADALVTGNEKHFAPDACRVIPVLLPIEFLASLRP